MDQILAAVTSLLVAALSVALALAVVPLLCKLLLPNGGGDAVWRGYWKLVRWAFMAPFKVCAMLIRRRGERR